MRGLLFCILSVLVSVAGAAEATDLRNVITDYTITSWNEKDGLPAATITALAQDTDGYLWIGTREGLLRFDGVRFTRWDAFGSDPLPSAGVRSLHVTRRGVLWAGFGADGLVAQLVDGRLTAYTGAEGLEHGAVLTITEDANGTVWAGSEGGLFAFDGTRWTRQGTDQGLPREPVFSAFGDRQGNVYVAFRSGVFVRRAKTGRFESARAFHDTYGEFAETPDGSVWMTDPTLGFRPLASDTGSDSVRRQGRGLRMLVDRKGSLWVGTGGQGLWRASSSGESTASGLERSTSLTGLLGDGVYALLEDRDGNIWAGTTEGLNRLTRRTIQQIIDLGLVRGVAMEPDGRVWVETVDELITYEPGSTSPVERTLPAEPRAMALDAHGVLVATGKDLFRIDRGGGLSRRDWPKASLGGEIDSVLVGRQGGLWLVAAAQGIVHWHGDRTDRVVLPEEVSRARITAAFVDTNSDAWFAFDNSRVAVVGNDAVVSLLPPPAGGPGVYRTIVEDEAHRVWLAGDGVLARFERGRLHGVRLSTRPLLPSVTAIVTDDRGALWLGASNGVMHLDPSEFDRAASEPSGVPRYDVYTRSDGIAGTPLAVGFNRGAIRALDGRLWFVTTRGITVLDPHVLGVRPTPVTVRFEGAMADDRRLAPGASVTLPAGTRKLEIDYTVVNLTSPLKARFRYRLDPFDRDWVDAGGRRQAFYTNLRPGSYEFRVVAADSAGGSTSNYAVWSLTVAPMFYQTKSFMALTALSLCLLLLAGWRLRERQLRVQFSLLLSERARLGREIHDTLLQGLVAIALQFDSLGHELTPMPTLQARFIRLRDRVQEYIREARRSIWDLHTTPTHRSLVDSLRRAGEFATDGCPIAFTLHVQGTPYLCPPQVEEQAVKIAQEAALNSVRHAAPDRLRIDLVYEDSNVTVRIADDGRGFDSRDAQFAGHYGITSMQERARSVGGALKMETAPGRGTEVTAVLPIAS